MDSSSMKSVPSRVNSHGLMIVSKNIEEIKQKLKEKNRNYVEVADLHVFKELCTHEDCKIRGIACKSISKLVESSTFPLPQALSWFIGILQSNLGNNQDGIICAITDLLLLSNGKHWSGFPAQHPFVLALKQNEKNWPVIEFQMDFMFKQDTIRSSQRAFSLLIPVFQYTLWCKGTASALCRRAAWKCLIKNFRQENFNFLIETISWFSTNERCSTLDVYHFLSHYEDELFEIMKQNNASDTICVLYAHTSCKLAEYGYDPASILQITQKLLREYPTSVNIVLALFAQALTRCPAEFLNTFLVSCVQLIEYSELTSAATEWLIISAILPWLIHSYSFTEDVHKTAEKLFQVIHHRRNSQRSSNQTISSSLISHGHFIRVVTSEEEVYSAFVIACSLEKSNHDEFLEKINELKLQVEELGRCPLLHLSVGAILLSESDFNIQSRALSILVELNAEFYLPHVLYLLAKAPCPELQLKLLHCLPLTAVEKKNMRPVLRSIDSLFSSVKPVLTNLSIKLYLTLWKIEERCYSYLHDRLLEYELSPSNNIWQKDVILTSAVRDICASKPDEHGKEWISILNQVIKRWHQKRNGSLPTALALDAIICLCRAEVLQVVSIYQMLSERLFGDNRVEVVKKFHSLIGYMFEATKMQEACAEVGNIVLHAVSKLLSIISSSAHDEVICSALNALSKFDKNEMPLNVVPNEYKELVELPRESLKKSENKAAEENDRIRHIPASFWIRLWQSVQPQIKPHVSDVLMRWLQEEVGNFPRSLYGSIRGEPKDLKILHDKCLFKAIVNYLRSNSKRSDSLSEDDLKTTVMCLKLLNGKLPKTLPLFNWTFLLLLIQIERPDLKEQIITLFAKQCCTSSSARVSVEDYLGNFQIANNEDDMKVVLNVLTDLCRGVSTTVLKNFLELVEERILKKSNNKTNETLLVFIWDRFSEALQGSDIDENNRICISEFVKRFWEKTSSDDATFPNLLNVAVELPSTYVDYLCSYDKDLLSQFEVGTRIELQCAMAMKSSHTPFSWLQKSIELTALFPEKQDFYFKCSLPVIKKYRTHSSCWSWLLQFISYIHSMTDNLSKSGIIFIYNTFIFTVVNLSIYEPFVSNRYVVEEYLRVFPQALNSFIITRNQSSSQIIDWLFIATKSSKLDQKYKTSFYYAIVSLKNDKYLSKISVRSKILS